MIGPASAASTTASNTSVCCEHLPAEKNANSSLTATTLPVMPCGYNSDVTDSDCDRLFRIIRSHVVRFERPFFGGDMGAGMGVPQYYSAYPARPAYPFVS